MPSDMQLRSFFFFFLMILVYAKRAIVFIYRFESDAATHSHMKGNGENEQCREAVAIVTTEDASKGKTSRVVAVLKFEYYTPRHGPFRRESRGGGGSGLRHSGTSIPPQAPTWPPPPRRCAPATGGEAACDWSRRRRCAAPPLRKFRMLMVQVYCGGPRRAGA